MKISAEIDWSYYGITQGMPYDWSDFSSYSGYDTRAANLFTKSIGKNYLVVTACYSNSTGNFIAFTTIDYDTVTATKGTNKTTLYFTDAYYWSCTFCLTKKSVSSSGGNFNGTSSRAAYTTNISDSYTVYVSDKYITTDTDLDIVGLTKKLLSNLWDDGTIFGDNYDMTGFLPYDLWSGKYEDALNNVGNDFLDYFKTLLGIDDSVSAADVEQIFLDINNNDYDNNSYLVDIDTSKRNDLSATWNNYKKFINNAVTYDTVNNVYKPNTTYLDTVYNNNSYFQTYIKGGGSLDISDVVAILNVISNQLDTTIFNALTDINANVTALGGIFANAINSAFADFKLDLNNLIGKININLKKIDDGITIGNSISTAINNTINPDVDNNSTTFLDKINLSFKALGDSITAELDNINISIKNITDNSTGTTPAPSEDDDFWKEVKKVLSDKIPLYKQCVDLISPLTSVTYSQVLDSHDDYLLDDTSAQNEISMQSLSLSSDDSQIDISYLSGLVIITYDTNSAPVGLKIPFIKSDWGIDSYIIDTTTYTSSKYKSIISDILLTICYVGFAWSVVHRISVWFGHTRSDDK